MKTCTLAAVLLVSLFATSMALPARKRTAAYRQPSAAYYQPRSAPQRLMVFQRYVQQPSVARSHARSSAYVAGDSVAAPSHSLKGDAGSVEQQSVAESVLNIAGTNDAEPYPASGGQVSSEFEGTFADGGVDTGISGAADVPTADLPLSGEAGEGSQFAEGAEVAGAPELPEVPELSGGAELPEAPIVDNQVLEDDSAPSAGIPEAGLSAEGLPSDDEAKVPREYNFEVPSAEGVPESAIPDTAAAPADESPIAEEAVPEISAVPEVPEIPEVPAVPSLSPEQAPAEEASVAASPAQTPLAAAAPAAGGASAQVPLAAPAAPAARPAAVAPPKRYLPPRKKVSVKLDSQNEAANDDDGEADADSYRPARVPNARRPVKGSGTSVATKGKRGQAPVGTYFPINFGGTAGGAIAIANSYSTGEGGSATSHAIAYGSPDAARSKARPSRRRH